MNATQDPRDFDTWFRATYRRVVESVALMAGSRDVAEDVTAEAFARALERWERVSAMESPEGWVLTVARNQLRRTLRRKALERRLVRGVTSSREPSAADDSTADDSLWRAVAKLSPREREVIAWRYVMDMKEAETARQMSIADGTVARLLHDARQKLRVALVNDPSEGREQMDDELDIVRRRLDAIEFSPPALDQLHRRVRHRRRRRHALRATALVGCIAVAVAGLAVLRDDDDRASLATDGRIDTTQTTPLPPLSGELSLDELAPPPFTIDAEGVQFVHGADAVFAIAGKHLYRLAPISTAATWRDIASGLPNLRSTLVMFDPDRAFVVVEDRGASALAELDLATGRVTVRNPLGGQSYTGASDGRYVYFVSERDTVRYDTTASALEVVTAAPLPRPPSLVRVLADGNVIAITPGFPLPIAYLDRTSMQWTRPDLFPRHGVVALNETTDGVVLTVRAQSTSDVFVTTINPATDLPQLTKLVTASGDAGDCLVPLAAESASTGIIAIACGELARIIGTTSVPAGDFPVRDEPYTFVRGQGGVLVLVLNQSNRLLALGAAPATTGTAPAPTISTSIAASGGRMPILAAVDYVWVGSQTSPLLQRINPATNRVAGQVQRAEPTEVLLQAFGDTWACGPSILDRIDSGTPRITNSYALGCRFGMTAGFGSLWLVQGTTVVRIDPVTGAEQARIAVNGGTWGITASADALWVADGHLGPGTVSRIDPNSNKVVEEIAVPVRTRNLVASHDAVWLTGEARAGQPISLVRIDQRTNKIVATVDAPADAVGLALLGNFVWVIGYAGDVAVVDMRMNSVVYHQQLQPPGTVLGGDRIATGFGSVWIASQQPGAVSRVDPGPYR